MSPHRESPGFSRGEKVNIEAALPERDPEPVMGPDGIFELAATELLRLAAEMRLRPGQ